MQFSNNSFPASIVNYVIDDFKCVHKINNHAKSMMMMKSLHKKKKTNTHTQELITNLLGPILNITFAMHTDYNRAFAL